MNSGPTHILVPVDVDVVADLAVARHLVDHACAWAKVFGARVTLCHVAPPVVTLPMPAVDAFGEAYRAMTDVLEARNAAAGRTLDDLKARAERQGTRVDVVLITQAGNIPELIAQTAHTLQTDLIVVATHGRHGLRRLVLGSVAQRVAHRSDVPVLLFPAEHGTVDVHASDPADAHVLSR